MIIDAVDIRPGDELIEIQLGDILAQHGSRSPVVEVQSLPSPYSDHVAVVVHFEAGPSAMFLATDRVEVIR